MTNAPISFEYVVQTRPFVVRRTIRWADCDPAGVVYTGNFTDYLLSAVMHYMRHLRGAPVTVAPEVELPCRHMHLDFHASLYPDDVVDITVSIAEVREHTFDVAAHARFPDGRPAFSGVFTPICIQTGVRTHKVPLPAALRQVLQSA